MDIITQGLEDLVTYGTDYICYNNNGIYTIIQKNKVIVSDYIIIPHYRLESNMLKFIKPKLFYCPPLDYSCDYAAEHFETTDMQFLKTGVHSPTLDRELYEKTKHPHTKIALYNSIINEATRLGKSSLLSIKPPSETFFEKKTVIEKIDNGKNIKDQISSIEDLIIIEKFHKNIFGKEYSGILKKYINEGFIIKKICSENCKNTYKDYPLMGSIISSNNYSNYCKGINHYLFVGIQNKDYKINENKDIYHQYLFGNSITTICNDFYVKNNLLKLKEPEQIFIPGLSWIWTNNDFKINGIDCNLSVLKARGGEFFKADLNKFSESSSITFQFDIKPVLNFIYHRETEILNYKEEIKIADYLMNKDYRNYILNYLAKKNLYGYYKIVNSF